jgi:hypothetical protein
MQLKQDEITETEIKERLQEHGNAGTTARDMIKVVRYDDHGGPGSIVYSLSGSPPKGYAICYASLGSIVDEKPQVRINLYDGRGKRFQHIEDIRLVEDGAAVRNEDIRSTGGSESNRRNRDQ